MSDMPCGECVVCEEQLDHADAGFCGTCGGAFHWGTCGEWGPGTQHECENCRGWREANEEKDDE